jgi:carboxypeptidase PM20D1
MFTLLLIVLIRTAMFKPKKKEKKDFPAAEIDKEKAVESLQTLIRCRTVSNVDKSKEDESEFTQLKTSLRTLYPAVFAQAEYQELSPRALLFHLKGSKGDSKHPAVFMAHFDVVDAAEKNWKEPPFEGVRKDGVLWGRGTIDTKGTLNGVLRAAEELLEKGFVPQNDFYFAFAGDEEISGGSAQLAVSYFKEKGIEPLLVLDEGGAVVSGLFPGVEAPIAVIGTAEKGVCALEFHLDGEGGHASAPAAHTPVGKLAALAVSIENHPFKYRLSEPVKEMFDTLGRESTFKYRMVFANLWLFGPILDKTTRKNGGQFNALVRTTAALTMMQGSPATNVIPSEAMIGVNIRLLPGDSVEEAREKLVGLAKKNGINQPPKTPVSWNASRVSRTDGEGFEKSATPLVARGERKHWSVLS